MLQRCMTSYQLTATYLPEYAVIHLFGRMGRKCPSGWKGDRSLEQRLKKPSIADQMLLAYPKGKPSSPPEPNADPGRFRNQAFFDKMYGNCDRGDVQRHLT